jgi:hypothetical protein
MSEEEALKVFAARGAAIPDVMTTIDLRAAYRRLAWMAHPDRGGASEEMALINAAYDILRKRAVDEDPQASVIRKRMRELSRDAGEQWRVRGFDGHFFRRDITVLGHPRIFRQMAETVRLWQTNGTPSLPCRAVFVQKPGELDRLLLVYADGKFYADKPIPMKPVSGDEAPIGDVTKDPLFVRWLPFTLNRLARDGIV